VKDAIDIGRDILDIQRKTFSHSEVFLRIAKIVNFVMFHLINMLKSTRFVFIFKRRATLNITFSILAHNFH